MVWKTDDIEYFTAVEKGLPQSTQRAQRKKRIGWVSRHRYLIAEERCVLGLEDQKKLFSAYSAHSAVKKAVWCGGQQGLRK